MSRRAFPSQSRERPSSHFDLELGLTKLEYATLMLAAGSVAVHLDINKELAKRITQSARNILEACHEREGNQ